MSQTPVINSYYDRSSLLADDGRSTMAPIVFIRRENKMETNPSPQCVLVRKAKYNSRHTRTVMTFDCMYDIRQKNRISDPITSSFGRYRGKRFVDDEYENNLHRHQWDTESKEFTY